MIGIAELNKIPAAQFTSVLAAIFEHSPWVAERAAARRPFASRLALLAAMRDVVNEASTAEQLDLVRAHPELAGRAAARNELTAESTREQGGAGLDNCTPQELAQLDELNRRYNEKFGFPFILAIRGHDRASIITTFAERVEHANDDELHAALVQIVRIAFFRINDTVAVLPGDQIMAMHEALATHSDERDALTCTFLRAAHVATAQQIRDFMLAAGLDAEIDAVGNVVGRWRCDDPDAKTLITGSHYDTVINAGWYDGRLGILLPIVVAQNLRQSGVRLSYDLEIVAFSEEEGVRFQSTFLGSSALVGNFDRSLLENLDADGVNMRDAMLAAGHDPQTLGALARDPRRLAGFVEVHIEQGPVLLEAGCALGVVTAIAGSVRSMVTVTGLAGHAGTVPMGLRRDAATAAAEIVLAVERCCSGAFNPPLASRVVSPPSAARASDAREQSSTAGSVVGTVGKLEVPRGAINVIPGRCELSIDIRSGDDTLRDAAQSAVLREINAIAARRNVRIEVVPVLRAPAAPCALALQAQLAAAIARAGDPTPIHLPSGAGHDAMKMAIITPVGMLFVRCGNGGISHHPDETLSTADAEIAARVFADFLIHFEPVSP